MATLEIIFAPVLGSFVKTTMETNIYDSQILITLNEQKPKIHIWPSLILFFCIKIVSNITLSTPYISYGFVWFQPGYWNSKLANPLKHQHGAIGLKRECEGRQRPTSLNGSHVEIVEYVRCDECGGCWEQTQILYLVRERQRR